jgi:hypothetical protein
LPKLTAADRFRALNYVFGQISPPQVSKDAKVIPHRYRSRRDQRQFHVDIGIVGDAKAVMQHYWPRGFGINGGAFADWRGDRCDRATNPRQNRRCPRQRADPSAAPVRGRDFIDATPSS